MGVIPAEENFLKTLRELTKKHNIVLIFDEIMTGFRTHPGCVQSEYNIIPDMTCLGKICWRWCFPWELMVGGKTLWRIYLL